MGTLKIRALTIIYHVYSSDYLDDDIKMAAADAAEPF